MCKGREDEDQRSHGSPLSLCIDSAKDDQVAGRRPLFCELCSAPARVYCQADDAFLCLKCDRWVHDANFLAQRHIRCFLCNTCNRLTQRYLIGTSSEVVLPTVDLRLKDNHHQNTNERRSQCHISSADLDSEEDSRDVRKEPFLFL
ncbi:OLC1v1025067C1 [Oldenlandia corymbosa var. corymbosa]|uniref:OLC1v1025067C1 n=1 Tax=Oldenlandia corymbosa var. corymbosa TaxID=529605 RepID=A0AAV1C778_OLDCO|nr:OLC1v1025067C1 [Oldenlandia corymbosa var. corymbosa]